MIFLNYQKNKSNPIKNSGLCISIQISKGRCIDTRYKELRFILYSSRIARAT